MSSRETRTERVCASDERPHATYLIDWWLPLTRSPGEWGGRWEPARDPMEARDVALAAIAEGPALGRVRITMISPDGVLLARMVADAADLAGWSLVPGSLPDARCDQDGLPPLGRDGLVHSILSRCRRLLFEAVAAGLIETVIVSSIVEIVDQAFVGVGPAIEAASVRAGRTSPEDLG